MLSQVEATTVSTCCISSQLPSPLLNPSFYKYLIKDRITCSHTTWHVRQKCTGSWFN